MAVSPWPLVVALPLSLALLADSAYRALYLLLRLADRRPPSTPAPPPPRTLPPLAVVIAAHDEADVVGATVRGVLASDYSADRLAVFVVADRCRDATAEVARAAGARVWERPAGAATGKAAALDWFLRAAAPDLDAYAALVVLDADSQVAPTALAHLAATLAAAPVVQGFVQPLHPDGAVVAGLAALSEILSQVVDDTARARLGWPVPLRGTGMAFPPRLLAELTPHLHTRVEDTELSVLLAARGIPIAFAPAAVIGDPKPADAGQAARQRARWLQGRVEVYRRYGPLLLRLLLSRRPGDTALVLTLALRPKTLVVALKAGLGLALAAWPTRGGRAVGAGLLAATAVDLVYYPAGLLVVDRPRVYAAALVRAPLYPLVWLRGVWTALRSREAWLSTRRRAG